jgi:natural product precursor
MKTKQIKKLTLNKETVAGLNDTDMGSVQGGKPHVTGASCYEGCGGTTGETETYTCSYYWC